MDRVYGIESRRIAAMIADFMDLPGERLEFLTTSPGSGYMVSYSAPGH
jgi:hypothetical protein